MVIYYADGLIYPSKHLLLMHQAFTENPYVTSFTLPHIKSGEKRNKKGAYRVTINGERFSSLLEGEYYVHLLEEIDNGRLRSFRRQVPFTLLEEKSLPFKDKKVRGVTYIADFLLIDANGLDIAIDIKGRKTPDFILKEKLFYEKYPHIPFYCIGKDPITHTWRDIDDIHKDMAKRRRKKHKAR